MDDKTLSFEEFVHASLPALGRYASALTRDRHAAEDLIQDTLVKVARAWPQVRSQRPIGYATTTMFRTYVSWWRVRNRTKESLLLLEGTPPTEAGLDNAEDRVMLSAAMETLPTLQRAVLVATYLDDAPDDKIAELVGRTPATVRSLRRRGLQALRAALGVTPNPAGHTRAGRARPGESGVDVVGDAFGAEGN